MQQRQVKDLLERYLRDHSAPNKAAMTHRRDRSLAAHLLRAFGEVPLDQLRPARLAEYKASRRAQGVAPKTLNAELGLLGHAYKLAMMEWEWVTDNPVLRIAKEKVRNGSSAGYPEEEQRLLAASPPWLQEIIVFALHTGMRRGEILKLHWSHVDLARRTLTILEQKNGARDTLPVNDTAMEVCRPAPRCGQAARRRSLSTGRATHGRRAICCGRSIRRCGRRGDHAVPFP